MVVVAVSLISICITCYDVSTYCNNVPWNSQNTRRHPVFPLAYYLSGKTGQTCSKWEIVKDYLECILLITVGISLHKEMMLRYIRSGPVFSIVTCNTD